MAAGALLSSCLYDFFMRYAGNEIMLILFRQNHGYCSEACGVWNEDCDGARTTCKYFEANDMRKRFGRVNVRQICKFSLGIILVILRLVAFIFDIVVYVFTRKLNIYARNDETMQVKFRK